MKLTPKEKDFKPKQEPKRFFKQCPKGGTCMNPLCMLGCVEY